ncbi:YkgJ family cysteine cluster protein [Pontibacter brevis]
MERLLGSVDRRIELLNIICTHFAAVSGYSLLKNYASIRVKKDKQPKQYHPYFMIAHLLTQGSSTHQGLRLAPMEDILQKNGTLQKCLNSQNMNDSINICLSCGYCCDGTVIGFVQLGREELPVLRELMEIENANGEGFFLQPCKNYCDGCSIYSKRPKQCASFECGLLKSFEQKKLSFDAAVETINVVKQKKCAIEKKLALLQFELQSQSFYFKMVELKNLLQKNESESSLTQNHLDLMSDLRQLDSLLSKEFGVSIF